MLNSENVNLRDNIQTAILTLNNTKRKNIYNKRLKFLELALDKLIKKIYEKFLKILTFKIIIYFYDNKKTNNEKIYEKMKQIFKRVDISFKKAFKKEEK